MLGGEGEKLGQALLDVFSDKSTRDAARGQIRSRQRATEPTQIGEQVRDAGGITMGQRSVPTRADLGAAPEPEFPVPAGSPEIRRLQQLRREIGPMQGPRESTSADYIFQPAIRGMRNPAGMEAPGTMFSSTGRVTEPGTKIGGRMMAGEYPSSPRRTVIRETEVEVSPGQMEMNIAPGKVRMKQRPQEGPMLDTDMPPFRAPELPVADDMRPRGVQVIDFGKLNKLLASKSPAEKAALLATLGLAGGVAVLGNMPRGERPTTQESPEMFGPPDQAPDAGEYMGGDGSLPPGDGLVEPRIQPPALTAEESGALNTDIENKITAIQQSDPVSAATIRAMAPKSPEQYSNIGDYYADRARFVRSLQQGGGFSDVVDAIKSNAANEEMAGNLAAFAKANPQMVYENMLRQGLINREGQMVSPEMNQQSQSVTSPTFGSSLGTNNEANALGQANAAASQMYTGDFNNDLEAAAAIQKNNELITAAAPIEYGNLQRPDQFLGQQLAMRMAGRMGGMG